MGREIVINFLKEHLDFTSKEFMDYLISKGYTANTANAWLWRLQKEGLITKRIRNRRVTIYTSNIYEGKKKKGDIND